VAGVEAVITGSDLTGRALAAACRAGGATAAVMDLLSLKQGARLDRRPGPERATRYDELLARAKAEHGLLVIGVEPEGQPPRLNPAGDLVVQPRDWVLVIQ